MAMNNFTRKLSLGAAIALSLCLLPQTASQAQFDDDPQQEVFSNSEQNGLNGNGSFNPLDLIHRATMGTLYDPIQFRNSTERNLNDAAAEFRRQRLELWQNQQQAQPTTAPAEATTPAAEAATPAAADE
ncbi:MAG: hypothetical protein HC910_20230 [Spirulinaceae cyanobacterium SM2_1_0]|nr:hypothetical protein [Spirulinaceae cyanobacterium SM2_1_0]